MAIGNSSAILAASVASSLPPDAGMRTGVVTAVQTNTVTVTVSGATLNKMPYLSSYSPVVGDNVNIVRTDEAWLVIGTSGLKSNTPLGWLDIVNMSPVSIGPTTGTTELEITNLQLNPTLVTGREYMINFQAFFTPSVATDRFQLIGHLGTFTGTQIVTNLFCVNNALGTTYSWEWPYTATATGLTQIHWGMLRSSGTGTLTVTGNPSTGLSRTWAGIQDAGVVGTVVRTV